MPITLTRRVVLLTFILAALSLTAFAQQPRGKHERLVYFGTYTGEKSKGIYTARLDLDTGALSAATLAAEATSPSFLAVHPSRRFLYAVNEVSTSGGKPGGMVSGFSIDAATGSLKPINQESSGGAGPAHLIVDRNGRDVLVANYGGGSVSVLPLDKNGRLKPATAFVQHTGSSVNPQRQKEPHAHSVNVDPANRFAYVADLGLDKILVYRFDAKKGTLAPANPPFAAVEPGAGPRHFSIHPSGRFAYVINELKCSVTAFTVDARTGKLQDIQTISTLPADAPMQPSFSGAEVQVHPSGRFLYASNRGHDSLAVFTIDAKTGRLTLVQNEPTQGSTPRGFGIDPDGGYLLAGNQRSDSVVVFRIDPQSGKLTPTGHKIEVGAPVSVKFVK